MKIIIENTRFDYNIGCRLLKTKYRNVPFKGLEDIWEDIVPITFKEITKELENIEQRRIAIGCLGLENIYKEVNPKLVSSKTISSGALGIGTSASQAITASFVPNALLQGGNSFGSAMVIGTNGHR